MSDENVTPVDSAALLEELLNKFAVAEASWLSSVRPDGRVHAAPIWHVWHEGSAYVCTPDSAVRTRNLATNPSVSLTLPDPYDVFIIEGTAALALEMEETLQPFFYAKYDWDITGDAEYNILLAITPRKIMAWGEHGTGRWHF
jgi:hypothetical protein